MAWIYPVTSTFWVSTTRREGGAKVERNGIGANQRFIVTDLPGGAGQLYSQVYCERGTTENRLKELQMGLFADRTSGSA